MARSQPIALVEPQLDGLLHAPFNAALLHTVALAFPVAPISFRGFPAHIKGVRDILKVHAPALLDRVDWRQMAAPPSPSIPGRWRYNWRQLRDWLRPRERVLFCSISRMMLMQLTRAMHPTDNVRAVLHGELDQLEQPLAERFPKTLFALPRLLRRTPPPGLRFIVLGRSIRSNIPAAFSAAFASACLLDHPYHFAPMQPCPAGPPAFGLFGKTGRGEELAAVARSVKDAAPNLPLWLIGFVDGEEAVRRLAPLVHGVGTHPLPRQVYIDRTRQISHALWLAPAGGYRLRASGTLFDALSFGKPLVYTANPYVDAYISMEPEAGTRCESLEHVPDAILEAARNHTPERYSAAQAAIARLRRRFTPEAQAAILPSCLGWE